MESRRISLLGKGYYDGRLDFDYKTPLSRLREDYLIRLIEYEEIKKVAYLRTVVDAVVTSGFESKDFAKLAFESYDSYRELALPYLAKKDNIGNEPSKNSIEKMKEIHERNKSAFAAIKKIALPEKPNPETVRDMENY